MTITPDFQFTRVLAVHPSRRGFGYAVFEGSDRLLDWGLTRMSPSAEFAFAHRIDELIVAYRPGLLALEKSEGPRRSARLRDRLDVIHRIAAQNRIHVAEASRAEIQARLGQAATTRYRVAVELARRYPELKPRLPRQRRPWMSEDDRMNIFVAVAAGITSITSASQRH